MSPAPQLLPSLHSGGTPKEHTKKRKHEAPSPDPAESLSSKVAKKARVNGSDVSGTQDTFSNNRVKQTPVAPPAVPTHVSPPKAGNGTKIPSKITPILPPVVPGMKH